jgi:uncharacterized protein (TIGR02466 family)
MTVSSFFAVPILDYRIPADLADELETRIVPELDKLENNGDDYDYRRSDFWETKILYHEIAPELTDEWAKCIAEYKEATSIQTGEGLHYWTQDYKDDEGHDMHGHGIDGISGVYWLRANENAGYIRFYNPNTIAEYVQHHDGSKPFFQAHYDVKAEKGRLVLFPSYLKHKVVTKRIDVVRTTIAFNVGI